VLDNQLTNLILIGKKTMKKYGLILLIGGFVMLGLVGMAKADSITLNNAIIINPSNDNPNGDYNGSFSLTDLSYASVSSFTLRLSYSQVNSNTRCSSFLIAISVKLDNRVIVRNGIYQLVTLRSSLNQIRGGMMCCMRK